MSGAPKPGHTPTQPMLKPKEVKKKKKESENLIKKNDSCTRQSLGSVRTDRRRVYCATRFMMQLNIWQTKTGDVSSPGQPRYPGIPQVMMDSE